MGQQPCRELAPAVPKARAGDAALPPNAKSAEVRIRPRLDSQSLQPRTRALLSRKFQSEPCRRSQGVARPPLCLKLGEGRGSEMSSHSSDSAVSPGAQPAKVRLGPCFNPQPLQSGTCALLPRKIQSQPCRCSDRVAWSLCCLEPGGLGGSETSSHSSNTTHGRHGRSEAYVFCLALRQCGQAPQHGRVALIDPAQLARMVLDAGLATWLRLKVS